MKKVVEFIMTVLTVICVGMLIWAGLTKDFELIGRAAWVGIVPYVTLIVADKKGIKLFER